MSITSKFSHQLLQINCSLFEGIIYRVPLPYLYLSIQYNIFMGILSPNQSTSIQINRCHIAKCSTIWTIWNTNFCMHFNFYNVKIMPISCKNIKTFLKLLHKLFKVIWTMISTSAAESFCQVWYVTVSKSKFVVVKVW